MLPYESKYSRHMRNMGNAAEYFMLKFAFSDWLRSRGAFQEICYDFNETEALPGGLLGLIFAGMCRWPLRAPSPLLSILDVANL